MNLDSICQAIRSKFKADIATPKNLLTQYDNVNLNQPEADQSLWCRLTVLPGDSNQVSTGGIPPIGKRFRTAGIFIASLYTTFDTGDSEIVKLADDIARAFRSITSGVVVFRTPSIARVGRAGKYWQVNVTVPWYSDTFS